VIFVLAARESRRRYELQLYLGSLPPGVLLRVRRFEIRRFSELPFRSL
jgi:hypothetical protein